MTAVATAAQMATVRATINGRAVRLLVHVDGAKTMRLARQAEALITDAICRRERGESVDADGAEIKACCRWLIGLVCDVTPGHVVHRGVPLRSGNALLAAFFDAPEVLAPLAVTVLRAVLQHPVRDGDALVVSVPMSGAVN